MSPRERRLAEAERQTATSTDKGHGRLEKRTLTSTTSLGDGYPDWPHLGQCFKLVRERTVGGKTTTRDRLRRHVAEARARRRHAAAEAGPLALVGGEPVPRA